MRAELDYLGIRTPSQPHLFRVASRRGYGPLLENGRALRLLSDARIRRCAGRYNDGEDSALVKLARHPIVALEILSGFEAPRPDAVFGPHRPGTPGSRAFAAATGWAPC
jgi:hypothetical protein